MSTPTPLALDLPDGDVLFYPSFFPQAAAEKRLAEGLTIYEGRVRDSRELR